MLVENACVDITMATTESVNAKFRTEPFYLLSSVIL